MNQRKSTRGLIAINGGLLAVLAAVTLSPASFAQRGGRARGEYTMVSGRMVGGNSHAIYIIDAANQEMVAAKWNDGTKTLDIISYRDLQADAATSPGR
jgi:hypothetical protein